MLVLKAQPGIRLSCLELPATVDDAITPFSEIECYERWFTRWKTWHLERGLWSKHLLRLGFETGALGELGSTACLERMRLRQHHEL